MAYQSFCTAQDIDNTVDTHMSMPQQWRFSLFHSLLALTESNILVSRSSSYDNVVMEFIKYSQSGMHIAYSRTLVVKGIDNPVDTFKTFHNNLFA